MIPKLRFKGFKEGYNTYKLGSKAEKIGSGITPKGGSAAYSNEGIPFIRSQNVNYGRLILDDTHITESQHRKMIGSRVLANDVLLNITGASIGRSCVVPAAISEANVNQHVCIIRSDKSSLSSDYLNYWLQSKYGQKEIYKGIAGGGREGLNFSSIRTFKISIPKHLEEQLSVTSLLKSLDQKINLLTKKKEALETYKKGLMQKIFSQELRFKREDGTDYPEWSSSTIRELFVSKKGKGLSLSDVKEDGLYKCLLYGSLYTKYNEVISECVEYTDYRETVFGNTNDLLVPASTTTSGADLATFSCLKIDEVMIGGDVTILTPINTQDSRWWAYYLSHYKKNDIAKFAQGSTIVHLYFNHFKKLKVDYPTIEEQKKIAEFLMNMDENISSVQTLINIHSELKNGLLQQMFV